MLSTGRLLLVAVLALVSAKITGSQSDSEVNLAVLHVGQGEERCSSSIPSCPDNFSIARDHYKICHIKNGIRTCTEIVIFGEEERLDRSAIMAVIHNSSSVDCALLVVCAYNDLNSEIRDETVLLTNSRITLEPTPYVLINPVEPSTMPPGADTTNSTGGTTEGPDITTVQSRVGKQVEQISEEVRGGWFVIFAAVVLSLILLLLCYSLCKDRCASMLECVWECVRCQSPCTRCKSLKDNYNKRRPSVQPKGNGQVEIVMEQPALPHENPSP